MKDNNKSKDKLFGFAKSVGAVAKNAAENLSEATKNTVSSISASVKENNEIRIAEREKKRYENDLKKYAPVFKEDIENEDFELPSMIRIVGEDVRREIKACEGAVGFYTEGKGIKVLNMYAEHTELLGNLKWYPFESETVYYVDPCHKKLYIRIDEYYAYLKKVRVDELTTIAQDLGAKHVEIILKAKKSNSNEGTASVGAGLGKWGAEANFFKSSKEAQGLEVAAQVDFAGRSEPVKPKTVYFKTESDIQALIRMRLTPGNGNQILSKRYSFKYGNSSGIKVSEAEKIDLALAGLGFGMTRSVSSEAISESNTLLEYVIEF